MSYLSNASQREQNDEFDQLGTGTGNKMEIEMRWHRIVVWTVICLLAAYSAGCGGDRGGEQASTPANGAAKPVVPQPEARSEKTDPAAAPAEGPPDSSAGAANDDGFVQGIQSPPVQLDHDVAQTKSHALRIDGYYSNKPRKVVLKDGIAFWSREGHELTVVCYPFVLDQQDVDTLRQNPSQAIIFGRHDKHRNPDPDLFEQTPLFVLKICFDPQKETTVDNATTTFVEMWYGRRGSFSAFTDRQLGPEGILEKVAGHGVVVRSGQQKNHVQGITLTRDDNQKIVELVAAGSHEVRWEEYEWNITLKAPVYDAPPREIVQMREWRESTGKFAVHASFVEKKDSQVVLAKVSGEPIAVAIDRLSESDQLFLASFGVLDSTGLREQQQQIIESFREAGILVVKDASRPGIPVSEFIFAGPVLESQMAQTRWFPRARKLHVRQSVGETFFEHVRELRQISELSLSWVTLNEAALDAMCRLSTVKKLWLVSTNLSDADMDQVNNLRSLTLLSLQSTKIGDRGLEALSDLGRLKYLDLAGTNITDAGMSKVEFDDLEHLDLSYTKTTDAAMSVVAKFSKLRSLILRDTEITAAGLAELQELEYLEKIHFENSQIDVDAIVPVLRKMKSLRHLVLRGGLPQSVLQEVREALPEADVSWY